LRTDREFAAREDRGRADETSEQENGGTRERFLALAPFEQTSNVQPAFASCGAAGAQRPTLNSEGVDAP